MSSWLSYFRFVDVHTHACLCCLHVFHVVFCCCLSLCFAPMLRQILHIDWMLFMYRGLQISFVCYFFLFVFGFIFFVWYPRSFTSICFWVVWKIDSLKRAPLTQWFHVIHHLLILCFFFFLSYVSNKINKQSKRKRKKDKNSKISWFYFQWLQDKKILCEYIVLCLLRPRAIRTHETNGRQCRTETIRTRIFQTPGQRQRASINRHNPTSMFKVKCTVPPHIQRMPTK